MEEVVAKGNKQKKMKRLRLKKIGRIVCESKKEYREK